MIALSALLTSRGDLRQVGAQVGTRTAKATGATMVGKAAMVASQTWWLAVVAGVGSSLVLRRGEKKRELYDQLRQALGTMDGKMKRRLLSPMARLALR